MNRGFVKVWRCIEESGLVSNAKMCQMFLSLLLKASSVERKQLIGSQAVNLRPGELVVGRKILSARLNQSEQEVRSCLKALEKMGIIKQYTTNRFTLISFVQWSKYQHVSSPSVSRSSGNFSQNIFPSVKGKRPRYYPTEDQLSKSIKNQQSTTIKEDTNGERVCGTSSPASFALPWTNLDKKYFLGKEELTQKLLFSFNSNSRLMDKDKEKGDIIPKHQVCNTEKDLLQKLDHTIEHDAGYDVGHSMASGMVYDVDRFHTMEHDAGYDVGHSMASGMVYDVDRLIVQKEQEGLQKEQEALWKEQERLWSDNFEKLWKMYPVRQAKQEALQQWFYLLSSGEEIQFEALLHSLTQMMELDSRWRRGKIPNLSRWLARKGWLDEPFIEKNIEKKRQGGTKTTTSKVQESDGKKDAEQKRLQRAERVLRTIKEQQDAKLPKNSS